MLTEKEYKDLSIKEFTKAAEVYDSGHAGIYEMCRNDYPPVLDELKNYPFQEPFRRWVWNRPYDRTFTERISRSSLYRSRPYASNDSGS